MSKDGYRVAVVVPSWNGKDVVGKCLDSLLQQSQEHIVIVVENGSTDGSLQFLKNNYPDIRIIVNSKNLGFDGGVNCGIAEAMRIGCTYVALLNNDAVADRDWLKRLVERLDSNPKIGIAASKLVTSDQKIIDSTGEFYSSWGLPFPRGRGSNDVAQYDSSTQIPGASGGASLYRVSLFEDVGVFDQDFFAYYEDIDISLRAQLNGWEVAFVPSAVVYHSIGRTSGKVPGFTTFQAIKNLPWVLWKNVPARYLWRVVPRFYLAYALIVGRALSRGQFLPVLKGVSVSLLLLPKKLVQRHHIQRNRRVGPAYIWSIMTHDLPPNAHALRRLRTVWWKLVGKAETGK